MSHPSHTGLFSYTSTYLQLVAVRKSASFPGPGPPSFSSYRRSAVAQGLKSSLIYDEYTYFRKNRVQIRKGREFVHTSRSTKVTCRNKLRQNYVRISILINSLHATGTFMCSPNTSALRDGHIYVPADVVQSYEANSKAKRAFGVNPCLLSSNKSRPHLFSYITLQGRQEGAVLVRDPS